jgi:hypothetical protein
LQQDHAAARVLDRLGDLENYPEQHLAPYEEFEIGTNTYYFTPGGFLYRKDPGSARALPSLHGEKDSVDDDKQSDKI